MQAVSQELLNALPENLSADNLIKLFFLRSQIALAEGRRLDLVHFKRVSIGKIVTQLARGSLADNNLTRYSEAEISEGLTDLITYLTDDPNERSKMESSLNTSLHEHPQKRQKQEWPTLQQKLVIGAVAEKDSIGCRWVTWYVRGTKNDDRLSVGKILRFLARRR